MRSVITSAPAHTHCYLDPTPIDTCYSGESGLLFRCDELPRCADDQMA